MNQIIKLWIYNKHVSLETNVTESIKKIANIQNRLFVLSQNGNLYKGTVDISQENQNYIELTQVFDFKLLDLDASKESLFVVTTEGEVFICDEQLKIVAEINLIEDFKCLQGHTEFKHQVRVKSLSVSEYGRLYISENNQLWGSGLMPQVQINSDIPKKILFFSGRTIHNISIGSDFAVVVVGKNTKFDETENIEDLFMPHCPVCLCSSKLTSPELNPSNPDICPLGVKVRNNSYLESMQSSKEDTLLNNIDNKQECPDKEDKSKLEKNIIFRNTEAAKEFLTRQISRMSSVGEEYLIECTEKPTRIIKENMSNVATLVYEGVKTVSDKVATLSRHVSSSSECNSLLESNNGHTHRKNFKEDILLLGSQSTSERDLSDVEMQGHFESIINTGLDAINKEVWTWGNIFHGVAGIGEIRKELPVIISALSNTGVCKISLQNHHACALTLDGRAYIWGQNNYHQVTLANNFDQMSPKLFTCDMNERVRDAVCGAHFTVILTDKKLTYFGRGSESYQILCDSTTSQSEYSESHSVNLFANVISSNEFSLFNLTCNLDADITDFVRKEQVMLEQMLCVHQYVIKSFVKKTSDMDNSQLYESLCKCYADILYFLSVSIKTLLEHVNGLISLDQTSVLRYFQEHISVYKNYCDVIYNIASINGFEYMSKLITIHPNLYKVKSGILKDQNNDTNVSLILLSPLNRIDIYTDFFRKYAITDVQLKWKDFTDYLNTKIKEAEKTRSFWLNSGKNVNYLIKPDRRLICDSQSDPISLQNSSRFSSHRFILFSDSFTHLNGSYAHIHLLTMIWSELQHHETLHLISLKMPEEALTLVAPDGVSKNKWYHALQHAINVALNKTEIFQPPLARNGTYTFTKNGFFKDATYTGRWLNAKMHGTGKVKWPDGRMYFGQFLNNSLSGYGTLEVPNVGTYEGQWKDNKQDSYGTFTYSNNDIYRGYFKNGVFYGHGLLRKGNFMVNSASLYIGEWVDGQKSGYGVMDEIATGEKYIGAWEDGKKEGTGLIVTSDGLYFEGNFHHDVLSGSGIMIMEDGSHYEGEFKGTGVLNGKGIITLPSGHVVEGNLVGSMQEGIKINSGLLQKRNDVQKLLPESFGKLCTPPSQKWKALFRHCYSILGLPENPNDSSHSLETPKIWQNVAVYLSNASTLKRGKGEEHVFQNSLSNLDLIPPFGKDRITMESYLEIKAYLHRAFESSFHPLGSLLNHLSEAYIASYSGKIHPILVTHAILEIIDLTQRIHEIIRYLFPALPTSDTGSIIHDNEKHEIINYQSLLYPIILPRIYNCLFTLLTLKNEHQEREYKKTLMELNKLSDHSLMSSLSVDRKFFHLDQHNHSSEMTYSFVEAIETLQQIKSMFLPIEKLTVIRNTVEKMTPVAQNLLGNNYIWNMDDLFPLFLYVVVRARIPDLGAELEFMENFMDPSLENGELGIMFTTLKACYQQILQDKSY